MRLSHIFFALQAGGSRQAEVDQPLSLDASTSFDPDNRTAADVWPFSFLWSCASPGCPASLWGADASLPVLTIPANSMPPNAQLTFTVILAHGALIGCSPVLTSLALMSGTSRAVSSSVTISTVPRPSFPDPIVTLSGTQLINADAVLRLASAITSTTSTPSSQLRCAWTMNGAAIPSSIRASLASSPNLAIAANSLREFYLGSSSC